MIAYIKAAIAATERWSNISKHTTVRTVPFCMNGYESPGDDGYNEYIPLHLLRIGNVYIKVGYGPDTDTLVITEARRDAGADNEY